MQIMEEIVFTTNYEILDADCKKGDVIALLKGKGENLVQLNGETILCLPTGYSMIRWTENHFCLLRGSMLSFYTLTGEFMDEMKVGPCISDLFPFKNGVICIYSDQGVFGKGIGKHILNYAEPGKGVTSLEYFALRHHLLYDALFARFKPYACIDPSTDELIFFNHQLKMEKSIKIPFHTGNVLAFAFTYQSGVFLEEERMRIWKFQTNQVKEYDFQWNNHTRAIFHRHDYLFMDIADHHIRVFTPAAED